MKYGKKSTQYFFSIWSSLQKGNHRSIAEKAKYKTRLKVVDYIMVGWQLFQLYEK